jgi:hypothetical protein
MHGSLDEERIGDFVAEPAPTAECAAIVREAVAHCHGHLPADRFDLGIDPAKSGHGACQWFFREDVAAMAESDIDHALVESRGDDDDDEVGPGLGNGRLRVTVQVPDASSRMRHVLEPEGLQVGVHFQNVVLISGFTRNSRPSLATSASPL